MPLSAARAVLYGRNDMVPLAKPVADVCAVAKKDLKAGEVLDSIGEYCYRSWAMSVSDARKADAIPCGLLERGVCKSDVKKGDWKLKIQMQVMGLPNVAEEDFKADSTGLVLFEVDNKMRAAEKDFIGTWEYRHNGAIHRREFLADHTANYFFNGEQLNDFDGAIWSVEDNVLILKIAKRSPQRPVELIERHFLRDRKALIFETQPYRNGKRVK